MRLAKAGATVVLTTRSAVKGQKAVEEVKLGEFDHEKHGDVQDLLRISRIFSGISKIFLGFSKEFKGFRPKIGGEHGFTLKVEHEK